MNRNDAERPRGDANESEVDRWLDDALAVYAKAEPRAGLEGRVVARLAAARRESRRDWHWWGVLAFSALAALVTAAVWFGRVDRRMIPRTPIAKVESPGKTASPTVPGSPRSAPKQPTRAVRAGRVQHFSTVQSVAAPKLEQFPSPSPLTEQEEMLALYVREFPERATLMARVQTETQKQDDLEMAAPWPPGVGDSSDRRSDRPE